MEISEAQIEQASLSVTGLKILQLYFLNNGRALIAVQSFYIQIPQYSSTYRSYCEIDYA
jgi:hypothetical protein